MKNITPPKNPKINTKHPLAKYLVNCFVFNMDGAIVDLVSNVEYEMPNGWQQKENSIYLDGSNFLTLNDTFESEKEFAIVTDVKKYANNGGQGIFSSQVDWASFREKGGLSFQYSLNGLKLYIGDIPFFNRDESIGVIVNKRVSLVSTAKIENDKVQLYENVKQPDAYYCPEPLVPFKKGTQPKQIGRAYSVDQDETVYFRGEMYHLYYFKKHLDYKWIYRLKNDPYQIVESGGWIY